MQRNDQLFMTCAQNPHVLQRFEASMPDFKYLIFREFSNTALPARYCNVSEAAEYTRRFKNSRTAKVFHPSKRKILASSRPEGNAHGPTLVRSAPGDNLYRAGKQARQMRLDDIMPFRIDQRSRNARAN
jgi:hypothetical protein